MAKTLLDQTKDLANQIRRLLSVVDAHALPREQQQLVAAIKRLAEDARLDVRDYEFANTQLEQQQSATIAKERFGDLQKTILKASEYNLFGAAEIATLSAQAETITDAL